MFYVTFPNFQMVSQIVFLIEILVACLWDMFLEAP